MSSSQELIQHLKAELKASGMAYAELAKKMKLSEASVKRLLAPNNKSQISLDKVDAICHALQLDFAELARRVADAQPLLSELSQQQEASLVANKKLLLAAICVQSLWTLEQMTEAYRLSETECVQLLVRLDRLGVIELKAHNRYRLKLAKTFRWKVHGPVMQYFREHAVLDYFSGGFNGEGEGLQLVHGSIGRSVAQNFLDRIQRVAQDFAQQHLADQKLKPAQREGFTLLLAMRSWEFAAFADLRR